MAVGAFFILGSLVLRGQQISDWGYLNPDEVELLFQARLARYSPTPFSTWITGTTGPYWTYLLLCFNALGAPMTLTFAHLLAAGLTGVAAAVLFVVMARVLDRRVAALFSICWWFPFAAIFPIGNPLDFGALSTEYLPMALIVTSALFTREQLALRPWLFSVVGLFAGLAVGSKFQAAPVALAFLIAQMIVMSPTVRRAVEYAAWWLVGAAAPIAALVVAVCRSKATNWLLVEQTFSFLGSYSGSVNLLEKLVRTWTAFTFASLYVLLLAFIIVFLGRRSGRRSNVARAVLVAGGLVAVFIGSRGFPHYLIFMFGAMGLAASLPVLTGAEMVPKWTTAVRVRRGVVVAAALILGAGYAAGLWRPLSPRMAAAALSPESVITNPTLTQHCPPGSPALVWGWAPEFLIAQNWASTVPYPNVLGMAVNPDIRRSAEPVFRRGIEDAQCVLDATDLVRPKQTGHPWCPTERPYHPIGFCLPPTATLSQTYPQLWGLVGREFHPVPIAMGCDGCVFYVRSAGNSSSATASAPRRNEK